MWPEESGVSHSVELQASMRFPVGVDKAWASLTEGDLARVSQPWGPIPGIVAVHDEPPGFFDEPGLTRTLENSDGSTMVETIRALDPPNRIEYTITELTNSFRHLTPGAVARFVFEPAGTGETSVTWQYSWAARNVAAQPLLWLIAHLAFRPYMRRMLERLSTQARSL